MVFYVTDVLWGVLYENELITLTYIDTVVYFVAMALSIFFWSHYVSSYLHLKDRASKMLKTIGLVFLAVQLTVLVINLFVPTLMFGFDDKGEYFAGPVRYVVLLFQFVMILGVSIGSLYLMRHAEENAFRRYLSIGASGIIMSVGIVLQVAFPLQPFYALGCLLSTCLLHTFVLGAEEEERRRELESLLRREQEQLEALDAARSMAHTDALTGLGNPHAYVDAQIDVDTRIADGSLLAFAVIAFDVNRLKWINDTRGHDEGDRWICAAAELVRSSFPGSRIFRVGGDEFVAILEGEDYHDRANLFARFNAAVEENLASGRVVISAGMSDFRLGRDFACHTVFTRADKAMYERKLALHEREDARV